MRYLAIDFGEKRIGLAVGDDLTRIAGPVDTISSRDERQRSRQLAQVIERHGVDALVLGLPLNMDGTDGPAARKYRALAEQFAEQFALPVHLVDERLSTHAANQKMNGSGLTRGQKKARRDALAATEILQQFLDAPSAP